VWAVYICKIDQKPISEQIMSEEQKGAKNLVDKMRTNTKQEKRKVWAKPLRLSRKKVPKARQKKA